MQGFFQDVTPFVHFNFEICFYRQQRQTRFNHNCHKTDKFFCWKNIIKRLKRTLAFNYPSKQARNLIILKISVNKKNMLKRQFKIIILKHTYIPKSMMYMFQIKDFKTKIKQNFVPQSTIVHVLCQIVYQYIVLISFL